MNSVIDNIFTRRSVRAFKEKHISKEDLETIAECAIYAPSARNFQMWQFTVVQNKEIIERLAKAVEKELDRPGYDFYKPDALIIATNDRECKYAIDDCACALQNMFLGANSLGIGSVWINQLRDISDTDSVRSIFREIGIPDNQVAYGTVALGYSAEEEKGKIEKKDCIRYVY